MTENKRFRVTAHDFWDNGKAISSEKCCELLNDFYDENEQLKYKNELLSEELEQCKAVINKRWSEYLQKKELSE